MAVEAGRTVATLRFNATDPTETGEMRQSFQRKMTRRWEEVMTANADWLRDLTEPLDYGRLLFRHRAWFRTVLANTVLESASENEVHRGKHWTGRFVRMAYQHGLSRAADELRAIGFSRRDVREATKFRARSHQEAVRKEYEMAYAGLDDETSWAVKETSTKLREGIQNQRGIEWLVEATNDRLDKTVENASRAHASTTIVQAVNEAKLNAYELVGVEAVQMVPERSADSSSGSAEIRVNVRTNAEDDPESYGEAVKRSDDVETDAPTDPTVGWSIETAGDDKVCDQCEAAAEAGVQPIAEIRRTGIGPPLHPNCRCEWSATRVDPDALA